MYVQLWNDTVLNLNIPIWGNSMFFSWIVTQPEFICSKLILKTPEQCVKPVQS